MRTERKGVLQMISNIFHSLAFASGLSLICFLEWVIVSKLLQIWDKAHPVDPRKDGDYHRPKDS